MVFKGYNTIVGSDSDIKFSPLQIQKISLARALLFPARILVIDGLVSSVEEELERRILSIVRNRQRFPIVIMTATKYNSIVEQSDFIFVMKNGQVVTLFSEALNDKCKHIGLKLSQLR